MSEQNKKTTLCALELGQSATVTKVGGSGALRQHFLDMGVIPGVRVTLVKYAPMGDPMELRIHGYELTLRLEEAEKIEIEIENIGSLEEGTNASSVNVEDDHLIHEMYHPRIGENTYGEKHGEPLPEGTKITFALAGNQNCGKTTLFNQLTGANQHVGNFPGVTVDRKSGAIKGYPETEVTDLPGIYSMSPYSNEEIVSRQFILNEKPKGIINIVDATNIERNLYLTLQLLELNVPMVIALNMMDELQGNGGSIRVNEMEQLLGVPVVPISAIKNQGVDELIEHAIHVAKYQERPLRNDFCSPTYRNGAVHRAIHAVSHLIEHHAKSADIPVRFAATKLIEGDHRVQDILMLEDREKEVLRLTVDQMEKDGGLDAAAAIADMRFHFIAGIVAHTVVKPKESKEHERSRKIDRILTGKYTAIPMIIAIMIGIFWLTFDVVGAFLQELLETGIDALSSWCNAGMETLQVSEVVRSLVIDGIFNGVGAVVSFLPIIVVLFFFLSLLEDTGYMARVAFVMDKLLRKIGLSGRSIVPMLIGFGCSVPAIMASRTLPSERDRKMTVLLIPFMSCSAKLPLYAFFTAAFFPGHGALVMVILYFTGIVVAILTALVSKNTAFKGEAVPFVMELPNYRMPSAKSTLQLLWEKAKDFLTKAFTIIFVATIVVWFLENFSITLSLVSNPQESILSMVAGWFVPLFAPMGAGDWRIVSALLAGFMAKESVASTLSILFGSTAALRTAITSATAASLIVFCLLYTPCVAAVSAAKRELGGKWAIFMVIFQCVIAWIVAWFVYLVVNMLRMGLV